MRWGMVPESITDSTHRGKRGTVGIFVSAFSFGWGQLITRPNPKPELIMVTQHTNTLAINSRQLLFA